MESFIAAHLGERGEAEEEETGGGGENGDSRSIQLY